MTMVSCTVQTLRTVQYLTVRMGPWDYNSGLQLANSYMGVLSIFWAQEDHRSLYYFYYFYLESISETNFGNI